MIGKDAMPSTPATLAKRVRMAIDAKGCSQADLARAVGIKPPSVADWLNGNTKVLRAKTALRAAHFLGVTALWLTEGKGPMTTTEASPTISVSALNSTESLFLQSVAIALETHRLPNHAMQTILMIIEASPSK